MLTVRLVTARTELTSRLKVRTVTDTYERYTPLLSSQSGSPAELHSHNLMPVRTTRTLESSRERRERIYLIRLFPLLVQSHDDIVARVAVAMQRLNNCEMGGYTRPVSGQRLGKHVPAVTENSIRE
jgi:hypothetical protein